MHMGTRENPSMWTGACNIIIKALGSLVIIVISPTRFDEIKSKTEQDSKLSTLKQVILDGWPNLQGSCPTEVHEFWNCRDELSYADGLILKGPQIVIPSE